MKIIEGVIPVGTPWGGPESRTYLCSLVSLLMKIEGCAGTDEELHKEHERRYFLYLAVSGIGMSTVWSDGLAPCSHEEITDRFFPDYVERTMAYAGYTFSEVGAEQIQANRANVQRRIVDAIDRGTPVLACSRAHEWSIVAGYDRGGEVLIGWDGAHTYWGERAIKPDGYLDDQMFAAASWPESVSRFVIVEGTVTPKRSSKEIVQHLVDVMEQQRPEHYDRELTALLADDEYCRKVDSEGLRRLWNYGNDFVGWYAENRCFSAFAFERNLPEMDDVAPNTEAVESLKYAAGFMYHTHDLCWEAWRGLRVQHKCDLPEDEPCTMCAGCLRPGNDEDFAAFRAPGPRHRLLGHLQTIAWNDAKALVALRKCAKAL